MIDHFAQPTDSAASAHQDEFEVRESWIDRIVVLSVCDTVDILSAPQFIEAIRDALGKGRSASSLTHGGGVSCLGRNERSVGSAGGG